MSGAQARNAIITKLIDLVKYRHLWGFGVSRRLATCAGAMVGWQRLWVVAGNRCLRP